MLTIIYMIKILSKYYPNAQVIEEDLITEPTLITLLQIICNQLILIIL